jgi:hypothetical protein
MMPILVPILLNGSPLPHVDVARILEKPQTVVERVIGPGFKQRRGQGYVFQIKGFDQFWVLGFGKDMTRIVCLISIPCSRDQALGCLGPSDSHASVRTEALGNAPIATRRNSLELTGVTGLPTDPYTRKPWKVEYEEDGFINRKRMDELKARIEVSTGNARIQLIRQCYDWRPKVCIQQ